EREGGAFHRQMRRRCRSARPRRQRELATVDGDARAVVATILRKFTERPISDPPRPCGPPGSRFPEMTLSGTQTTLRSLRYDSSPGPSGVAFASPSRVTLARQPSWRTLRAEISALASLTLTTPFGWLIRDDETFDPGAPHPIPVVFVHGLFGNPTNFLALRSFLAARGVLNFSSFSYRPRIDLQRLAPELGDTLDAMRNATGAHQVDVVGHSLGGLVARYLIEI